MSRQVILLHAERVAVCATRRARFCCACAPSTRSSLEERDIEADDALLRAYLERIPVVTIDGVEAFEFFVDESELDAAARLEWSAG